VTAHERLHARGDVGPVDRAVEAAVVPDAFLHVVLAQARLAIQQPSKFLLVINGRTANALSIPIPQGLRARQNASSNESSA
jgi:hypothetical protein